MYVSVWTTIFSPFLVLRKVVLSLPKPNQLLLCWVNGENIIVHTVSSPPRLINHKVWKTGTARADEWPLGLCRGEGWEPLTQQSPWLHGWTFTAHGCTWHPDPIKRCSCHQPASPPEPPCATQKKKILKNPGSVAEGFNNKWNQLVSSKHQLLLRPSEISKCMEGSRSDGDCGACREWTSSKFPCFLNTPAFSLCLTALSHFQKLWWFLCFLLGSKKAWGNSRIHLCCGDSE